jgi:hypothetical protein
MVLKFLGLGKKSEYFLEAEPLSTNGAEATPSAGSAKAQSEPAKTESVKTEPAQDAEAESDKPQPVKLVETLAQTASAAVTNGSAPAEAKATKSKKTKKTKKEPAEASTPAPKGVSAPKPAVSTFATDHLLPTNTPRRRPGPSLDLFRNMAKDVKKSR